MNRPFPIMSFVKLPQGINPFKLDTWSGAEAVFRVRVHSRLRPMNLLESSLDEPNWTEQIVKLLVTGCAAWTDTHAIQPEKLTGKTPDRTKPIISAWSLFVRKSHCNPIDTPHPGKEHPKISRVASVHCLPQHGRNLFFPVPAVDIPKPAKCVLVECVPAYFKQINWEIMEIHGSLFLRCHVRYLIDLGWV